jgi:hypothetical protein
LRKTHARTMPSCFGFHNRIKPTLRKRVTPQHAPDCHQTAAHRSVSIYRFHCVFGARRYVLARRQEHGRDGPFVCSEHEQHDCFRKIHPFLWPFEEPRSLALLGMTTKFRMTTEFGMATEIRWSFCPSISALPQKRLQSHSPNQRTQF